VYRSGVTRRLNSSAVVMPASTRTKHTLPDLPYDYNALEPVISAEIMQIHHSKHHATYVTNLNVAEEKLAEAKAKNDVGAIVALGPALKFNGGGHINHSIFWQNLSPKGGGEPTGTNYLLNFCVNNIRSPESDLKSIFNVIYIQASWQN